MGALDIVGSPLLTGFSWVGTSFAERTVNVPFVKYTFFVGKFCEEEAQGENAPVNSEARLNKPVDGRWRAPWSWSLVPWSFDLDLDLGVSGAFFLTS